MKRNRILVWAASLILAGCAGSPETETELAPGAAAATEASGIALPAGFTAELFAAGLPTPRHIVVNGNGDVYVTLRSGQAKFRATDEPGGVAALRDTDGDGAADVQEIFGTPDIDTGLAIHEGHLYFASMTTIYAVALDDGLVPSGSAEVVVGGLPQSASGHRTKPITFDTAGNLYTQVGAPSNACQTEPGTPGSPGLAPCTQLDEHGGRLSFQRVGARPEPRTRRIPVFEGPPQRGRPGMERGGGCLVLGDARPRRSQPAMARAFHGSRRHRVARRGVSSTRRGRRSGVALHVLGPDSR